MIQRRYELSDFEWSVIAPLLPNKPRGVPRVDDRRVLNGIYWRLRTGSPWADIPERYGPATTCYNRFVRWRKLGVWDRLFEAVSKAHEGDVQMVDSSSIRVHQHAANGKKGARRTPPPGMMLQADAWGARAAGSPPRSTRSFGLASVELSVSRVATRVLEHGHGVAELKLRERFPRTQKAIAAALTVADASLLADNSRDQKQAFTVCRVETGGDETFDVGRDRYRRRSLRDG